MKNTFLILLFATVTFLAFFAVNAEPIAEPLAEPLASPNAEPFKNNTPYTQQSFIMVGTMLIRLFAMVGVLAFFEVNTEPFAEPFTGQQPDSGSGLCGRVIKCFP
ncbi:hypothetical protein M0802_003426 [Mischocyttarus mexicanus]|nr:hypothetical protein M0802_003426 [Mischocyttarus mexicanus]